jgi:hypothetical protein
MIPLYFSKILEMRFLSESYFDFKAIILNGKLVKEVCYVRSRIDSHILFCFYYGWLGMIFIMFVKHEYVFLTCVMWNVKILCFPNLEHFCEFGDSGRINYVFACKWNIIGPLESLIFIHGIYLSLRWRFGNLAILDG